MTTTLEAPPTRRTNNKPTDVRTKKTFTTGEAAKICNLSQQTIIRCFDTGRLKGFRVPGSRFRRITREDLIVFMKENNIPTDDIIQTQTEEEGVMNTRPWEHRSRYGTVFTSERCDLVSEVIVQVSKSISEERFARDIAEAIGAHATTIHPHLNGFTGYGTIVFKIVRV